MKILYIANARIPTEKAHGRRIMKTCEALANIGQNVELWVPKRKQPNNFKKINPFNFYRVLPVFKICRLFALDLLPFTDHWLAVLDSFAYIVLELSFVFTILLTDKKKFAGKIIYTRCLSAAVAIKFIKGNPVFYECHDIGRNYFVRKIYFFLVSLLDGLVVVSVGLEKVFSAGGITKIIIVPAAVDIKEIDQINRVAARRQLKFGIEKIVVYAGRLTRSKGVYSLIEAAKKMTFQQKNIDFYFVGASTENDWRELELLTADNKRINFVGHVSPHDSLVYQRAADVLVLPGSGLYDNSREYTSPLKLFEYLASGVPIVATNVPANREVLTHKLNAYLVQPDNPTDLANGIENILKDKELAKKISSQALKDSQKYTWDHHADQIMEFIKNITKIDNEQE